MLHVLVIGAVFPESSSSAGGSRTMQLIKLFKENDLNSESFRISFATVASKNKNSDDLEKYSVDTYPIQLNDASFNTFISKLNPDIVIFDKFNTEEQFGWRVAEYCPDALRVLDTIDLHCLRETRRDCIEKKISFENRFLLSNSISYREIASIYRCDISLIISEVEMKILKDTFLMSDYLIHYTPFLLEPLEPSEIKNWKTFEERKDFVSIGNFLHAPNWDAVLELKKNIWNSIRQKIPDSKLHIYGAYSSQKVNELHNPKEGFIVNGRAQSLENVMSNARLNLAPIRFGAGLKGKLIDAMRYGTPSVTTTIGAEGMCGNLPWAGEIVEDMNQYAEKAVALYNNKIAWNTARKNGIEIINQHFSEKIHGQKLVQQLLIALENLKFNRENNFIGNMLHHHTVDAVKFKSLYIEMKNRIKT